ncbi:hypothetical protein B0H14DRAFT_2567628 [Mycena olivaceomarginata]|nr:hypothetical protein B0H14DRAFT_2567628 [Mycena olivaceomarginata]
MRVIAHLFFRHPDIQMSSKKKKDAPRGKAGRPARKYRVNGRQAAKETWNNLVKGLSLSPEAPDSTAPSTGGTILTGDATQATLLATRSYGIRSERREATSLPVFLDDIKNKHRKLLATIPTENSTTWFDAQLNDFTAKGPSFTQAVDLKFFGHPGDSEFDVRARPFVVRWSRYLANPDSDLRKRAVQDRRVVARWKYHCSGLHDLDLGDLEETAAQSGSEPASPPHSTAASLNESATVSQEDERNRWNKCGGKVKLYVRRLGIVRKCEEAKSELGLS